MREEAAITLDRKASHFPSGVSVSPARCDLLLGDKASASGWAGPNPSRPVGEGADPSGSHMRRRPRAANFQRRSFFVFTCEPQSELELSFPPTTTTAPPPPLPASNRGLEIANLPFNGVITAGGRARPWSGSGGSCGSHHVGRYKHHHSNASGTEYPLD